MEVSAFDGSAGDTEAEASVIGVLHAILVVLEVGNELGDLLSSVLRLGAKKPETVDDVLDTALFNVVLLGGFPGAPFGGVPENGFGDFVDAMDGVVEVENDGHL